MEHQWRSQTKIFERQSLLSLSEQQYFVLDSASQSTKWQDMLEIGRIASFLPRLRLCGTQEAGAPEAVAKSVTPCFCLRSVIASSYIQVCISWSPTSTRRYHVKVSHVMKSPRLHSTQRLINHGNWKTILLWSGSTEISSTGKVPQAISLICVNALYLYAYISKAWLTWKVWCNVL